jgi:lambda family phage portal protein
MSKRKTSKPRAKKQSKQPGNTLARRGYRDIVGTGSANADWWVSSLSEDADLWQNSFLLTSRMRDLFKTNPIFVKYRELLWANIFGENGIMLRMKIKETEDRVVNAPPEKWALVQWERRVNRIIAHASRMDGKDRCQYRAYKLAEAMERSKPEDIFERKAIVQVGDPDVFANRVWEKWWTEWQRAEYCDIRGRRNYHVLRQLRLINGVRDGDFFIRTVSDPKVNSMGYTLQMISAEWCDRFFNAVLPNGNVVIMGIEYQMTVWGVGQPVAFYFITRQANDWQFTVAGSFNFGSGKLHQRVPADEIIHYARPVDADSTRPAPWAASCIPSSRQLDQAMLAEVIAWRESACKTGFYYSDVLPEGGGAQLDAVPDPRNGPTESMAPGGVTGLEWGVKYQERNPTHPNANVEAFRKASGRQTSAGMPGGDYNILFNDLENINFSAGRLGRLDTNEMSKMLQRFDIDVAERPIFERGMEMALIVGAVPLPNSKEKLKKFNKPLFQGRRWAQVDEIKAINSAALRIANKLSSRNRECSEEGIDFEDNAFELAEEEILLEALGLDTGTTVEKAPVPKPGVDVANQDEVPTPTPTTGATTTPSATTKPKKSLNGANGGFDRTISIPITIGGERKKKTITFKRDKKGNLDSAEVGESAE